MATTTTFGNVVTAVVNNIAKIKTAIGNATTSAAGLMSNTDKSKLDGIATGANKTTVDSALSTSSANPVQNKVVAAQINSLNGSLTERTDVITTAGLHASAACSVTTSVIRKFPNGHYIIRAIVTAMNTVDASSQSSQFAWLQASALIKPTMNALSCSNFNIKSAIYPAYSYGGLTDSAIGYGIGVQYDATTGAIGIGRFYNSSMSFGSWPISMLQANKSVMFELLYEIY